MENHEFFMKRCIELAKKGGGNTSPNPMVGCVVLNKNNEIISEGYHHKYGENHAERDALLKLKNGEEKGGTIYINLEPCSHYGKTPPCADLIIDRGIKKAVIGIKDNNPKVNGMGIKKLKDAGIEVITGILEDECRELNEIFFTDIEQNRIFIALKTATTIDGKIATYSGDSKWITSNEARESARELRHKYDALLTSSATVIKDNPKMEHKLKIILDRELKTDFSSNIYKTGNIYVITGNNNNISQITPPSNVKLIKCSVINKKLDLTEVTNKLYSMEIKSVFVEAGGTLSGDFIKNNLYDKIYQFIAPKILNDNSGKSCFNGDTINIISESKNLKIKDIRQIGTDVLITYSKS